MPRMTPGRSIYSEQALVRRIAYEREQRGWSYSNIAKRMTDVGCPLDQSAIYKIEKADPPRRIVVDELVAFSRVFGLGVTDLLLPPEAIAERAVKEAVERLGEAHLHYEYERAKIDAELKEVTDQTERALAELGVELAGPVQSGPGWVVVDLPAPETPVPKKVTPRKKAASRG